jgi:hypothetical protein
LGYLEATTKTKYGGLSTTAAKCAASGRDDGVCGDAKENKQRQRQKQVLRLRISQVRELLRSG